MKALRKTLDALYGLTGAIAGLCIVAIFVIMIVSSVMREMGLRTGGTDDIVSWITACAAFSGLAHTFKHGDFVRVGLLLEKLGPGPRRAFELASLGIATVFIGYVSWSVALYVLDSYAFNDMATGLIQIPLWIPQSSLLLGSTLLFIALLDEFFIVLRGHKPTYVRAVEERHARGDFSEDV
ncbi:MAG: TRAP transporter small permease [Burkholderiaceae bacterium]